MKKVSAVIAVILSATTAFSGGNDKSSPLYGVIDSGIRFGNTRTIGEINATVPFKIQGNSLYFMNYIGKTTNRNGTELNLGFAKRTLYTDYIDGIYGYFDIRKTPTGNTFTQLTFGKEWLGKEYDARINTYLPLSKTKDLKYKKSTPSVSQSGTVSALTNASETPMAGFDVEYGKLSRFSNSEFGSWVGYYYFTPISGDAQQVKGMRIRTEYRFANMPFLSAGSKFILGFEVQSDRARGVQEIASVRVSVPFGEMKSRTVDFTSQGLESRMLEPIIRDVDIVTGQNQVQEDVIDKLTGKIIKKIVRVKTQQELSDAISGDDNTIIVLENDIRMGLSLRPKKGQIIISGNKRIDFTTAKGGVGGYQPASGKIRKILAKYKSQKALFIDEKLNIRGVTLVDKNLEGEDVENDVVLLSNAIKQIKTGDVVKTVSVPNSNPKPKTYSLICSDGGDEFTASRCDSALSIDAKTGDVTVNKFIAKPVRIFKVVATDTATGSKIVSDRNIFRTEAGVQAARDARVAYLPNTEVYKGIRLDYGDDYKCSGDNDRADATCTTAGRTKLAHVKRVIDKMLEKIESANGEAMKDKVIKSLLDNKATMTLFNSDNDKSNGLMYLTSLKAPQDLQASETFSSASDASKGEGSAGKRDATLEEVLHLVQNYGLKYAKAEWQDKLNAYTEQSVKAGNKVIWKDTNNDGILDGGDLPRSDLDDEYFAGAVEAYFNIHKASVNIKGTSVCQTSTDGSVANICSGGDTSRKMLETNHKNMFDLVKSIFGDKATFYE